MRPVWTFGLVLMLAACGRAAPEQETPAAPPQVRVATIATQDSAARITGVGTVALRRETSLGFTSAGRIERLTVNEGDRVRRGQLLAALDTTTVQADLARARAEQERARAEFRRSENLMAQGWITRPRLETAKAALEAAEANVQSAGFQTDNATITAPGSGIVLSRLAEPGQVVAAGTPVLIVGEAASGYVLRVPLSDREAARLTRGAPARVTIGALGDAPINGYVIELAGRSDRATGTFAIEIALPNDPRLKSGQIGDASIVASGRASTAITVPSSAVFSARGGDAFVYVIDPQTRRARLRKVAVAETTDGGVRVTGGIARGEQVAVSRIDRLADGMLIKPIGAAR